LPVYNRIGIFEVVSETLSSKDGRTVLRLERRLAHPAEKVWRALTEPSELAGWFPAAVEVDLRLDGRIAFEFPGGEDDFVEDPDNTGVVRAYEPPHLLEYSWGVEVLRWELSPTGDGCLLVLTATYDDRPGSASFTSGWLLCFDALDRVLGGSAIPREDYAELHEHFVKVYGLDRGEALDDGLDAGAVRFERQLIRPKEQVWSALTGAAEATVGVPPPAGFVAKGIEPGPVEVVTPSVELVYPAQHGTVRWQLRDGNGGARLVVTQSGPAEPFLPAWHDLIESLAVNLLEAGRS
jgi:uncharacterized protein YndB with AHSA1/START domain